MFDPYTSVMIRGERFNSISHLVGAALALAGAVVLVVAASRRRGVGMLIASCRSVSMAPRCFCFT